MAKFKKGDRVRATSGVSARLMPRGGVIIKEDDEENYPRVLWDGLKGYVYFPPDRLMAEPPLVEPEDLTALIQRGHLKSA